MKKYFTVFTILFSCFFLKAQEIKNEISIKIGYGIVHVIKSFLKKESKKHIIKTKLPLVFINYKRSLSKRWDIEGSIGYEKYTFDLNRTEIIDGTSKDLSISNLENLTNITNLSNSIIVNISNIRAGIGINFNYIKKEKFQLYSGIGIGLIQPSIDTEINHKDLNPGYKLELGILKIDLEKTNKFSPIPIFHFNALGFRYGEKFGITSEVGFGYKDLISLGLSYRF